MVAPQGAPPPVYPPEVIKGPQEEALAFLKEAPPNAWNHFVIPVAQFAMQHLQQQQQQQQQEQQEQGQQQHLTSEAVWSLVQQLFISKERGPHPGGLMLLWNSQETLRPLVAEKPDIRPPQNPKFDSQQ